MNIRLIQVHKPSPEQRVFLRIAGWEGERMEEAIFVKETTDNEGEKHRTFRQRFVKGGPVQLDRDDGELSEWQAYLYKNQWCLGSGATSFALYREETEEQEREREATEKRDALRVKRERLCAYIQEKVEELEGVDRELEAISHILNGSV